MTPNLNGRTPAPPHPVERDPRLATRIAALQAAATFAAGVVLGSSTALTSADLLKIADAFVRWLDEP
jgi:hypothetical protein